MDSALPLVYALFGALGCALTWTWARALPALPRSGFGQRGDKRTRALQGGLFRLVEPAMRWLAGRITALPLGRMRAKLETTLLRSGSYLGLCADELLALCLLASGALGSVSVFAMSEAVTPGLPLALAIGGALPVLVMLDHKRGRERAITRRLPGALDLFALALNAGLDFSSSIEVVSTSLIEPNDPLREELRLVQHELAMGRARIRALRSLADRTDAPALRDLVRVVIQADRKGAPLASVLETQAEVARNQRSILAEEAAARASIMLLGPLMLMLLNVLFLLLAPIVIRS